MGGMMFEVASEVVNISTLSTKWTGETLKVFVKDFQNFLIRKFGSIELAWAEAFDTDGSGSINFTEFGLGCKASGYVGNATRLWAALDSDYSGEISMAELNTGVTEMTEFMKFHDEEASLNRVRLSIIDLLRISDEAEKPEKAPSARSTMLSIR